MDQLISVVTQVNSPIILIAFIILTLSILAVNYFRIKANNNLKILEKAPEAERATLIDSLWDKENLGEFYPGDLSRKDRSEHIKELLRQRTERFRLIILVLVIILLVVGGLIALLILTTQPVTNGAAVAPTAARPPDVLEEVAVYTEDDLADDKLEYVVEENTTWPSEAAEQLIRLVEVRNVVLASEGTGLENTWALEATFLIENLTSNSITLTVNPAFFTLEDEQGREADRLYFCCATDNAVLNPSQTREVTVMFADLWSGGKWDVPEAFYVVRGLRPVVRAKWYVRFLLAAD